MRTFTKPVAILAFLILSAGSHGAAQTDGQTVLGPGLYVFQTRTRSAVCEDDERTGYVSSFVAPIHGVPGSRTMRMQLLNSPWWSRWTIVVDANDRIVGDSTMDGQSGPNAARNHFELERDRRRDRFTGTGTRTYMTTTDGQRRECAVTYDALLRRLDEL